MVPYNGVFDKARLMQSRLDRPSHGYRSPHCHTHYALWDRTLPSCKGCLLAEGYNRSEIGYRSRAQETETFAVLGHYRHRCSSAKATLRSDLSPCARQRAVHCQIPRSTEQHSGRRRQCPCADEFPSLGLDPIISHSLRTLASRLADDNISQSDSAVLRLNGEPATNTNKEQ
ncbi:hypothetical protein BDV10DRAFT_118157 [Aspergillus recurvatus]